MLRRTRTVLSMLADSRKLLRDLQISSEETATNPSSIHMVVFRAKTKMFPACYHHERSTTSAAWSPYLPTIKAQAQRMNVTSCATPAVSGSCDCRHARRATYLRYTAASTTGLMLSCSPGSASSCTSQTQRHNDTTTQRQNRDAQRGRELDEVFGKLVWQGSTKNVAITLITLIRDRWCTWRGSGPSWGGSPAHLRSCTRQTLCG
jgi:hypothetical protein